MSREQLDRSLRAMSRSVLLGEMAYASSFVLGLLIFSTLLAVGIDATLSLPEGGLWTLGAFLLASALAGLCFCTWVSYCNRYRPRRIARLAEQRLGGNTSRLINAVDLSSHTVSKASEALCSLAVSKGGQFAATIKPRKVVDGARVKKGLVVLAVGLAVAAAACVIVPEVFSAVIPRLLAPWADHPPFTLVRFNISIEPEKVYRGRPVAIEVDLESAASVPENADVVFLAGDEPLRQSLPMQRVEAGRFRLSMDRVTESRWFFINTERGRSKRHFLEVHQTPMFQRVRVRYEFPSYTKWQPGSVLLKGSNRIAAIEGTTIVLTVESNLPLARGEILLEDPSSSAGQTTAILNPTTNIKNITGSFALRGSGKYAIKLFSDEGIPSDEAFRGRFVAIKDELPDVNILEPDQSVIAPVNWKIPVTIEARDDVAVDRILLYRGVNGWGPTGMQLPLERTGPTYARASAVFDLESLGAEPGDVITYFSSAYDVFPNSEHFADTSIHVIRVISQEEYLQFVQEQYRMEELMGELDEIRQQLAELDRMREELLEEMKALKARIGQSEGQCSKEDKEKLQELTERQKQYAGRMEQLARKLQERIEQPQVWDVEEMFEQTLRSLAESLNTNAGNNRATADKLAERMQGGPSCSSARQQLDEAISQLEQENSEKGEQSEQMERTQKQLEQLAKADELIALTQAAQALTYQQRELADRMAQFRNKENLSPAEEIRAGKMGQEQLQLKQELDEIVRQMHEKAAESRELLPKMSASVEELASLIDQLNVAKDQLDAATLAKAGQGRYAYASCDNAATKLESLIKKCCGKQGMPNSEIDKAIGMTESSFKNNLGQLSASRGITGAGGEGGGYYGSRASIRMVGPHRSGGQANAKSGYGTPGSGRGGGKARGAEGGGRSPDVLDSELVSNEGQSAGGDMPGVPPRHRSLVEAYFRRLADESN